MAGKTLYDKLWDSHLVSNLDNGTSLIYIDLHYLHEVTSPQAFEGLRLAGRKPWRAGANMATPDHNVPTTLSERSRGVEGIVDLQEELYGEIFEPLNDLHLFRQVVLTSPTIG